MSNLSEADFLNRLLTNLPAPDNHGPIKMAIVGIGHELRGDDAVGIVVARALESLAAAQQRLLVIETGPVPESFVGVLRRFGPDLVLLVDAAQLDAAPGTIRWVKRQEISGISAFTHTLPLSIFANYLVTELGCEVVLLGIQPSQTAVGTPLSPIIQERINTVVQLLTTLFHTVMAAQSCVE